jgi:superoxide dismutase, Fe-Mn family
MYSVSQNRVLTMFTRRDALKMTIGSMTAMIVPETSSAARIRSGFALPKLPYAYDALEPHIDAKTMEIHHDRHHQASVDGLNAALKDQPDWLSKPVDEVIQNLSKLPEGIRTTVRNMGGGHYNHTLFWNIMKKDGGQPTGELLKAIETAFGTLEEFQKAFTDVSLRRFGSGWAWLLPTGEKGLSIVSTANQDSTLMEAKSVVPILGLDVWEHAFYLKYQYRRADYVKAWWNVVNWDAVAANLAATKKT